MSWLRPFRRDIRPVPTFGGNASMLDEVEAEGPMISPRGIEFGLYEEEKVAAVRSDLSADFGSSWDELDSAEDHMYDALGTPDDSFGS